MKLFGSFEKLRQVCPDNIVHRKKEDKKDKTTFPGERSQLIRSRQAQDAIIAKCPSGDFMSPCAPS